MHRPITTIAELNQLHKEVWAAVRVQMDDDTLLHVAGKAILSDARRNVSFHSQISLREALDDAAEAKKLFLRQLGRRGRQARKFDALHDLIGRLVQKNPDISFKSLENKLREMQSHGTIDDVTDTEVHFNDYDDRLKQTSLTGLKHRLTRAKKAVRITSLSSSLSTTSTCSLKRTSTPCVRKYTFKKCASGRGYTRSPMQSAGKINETFRPFMASAAAIFEPIKPPPMTANSAPSLAAFHARLKSESLRK
jgi:serine/threonine protein kinase